MTISLSPSQDRVLYGIEDTEGSPEITETGIIQPWEQTFVPQGMDDPVLNSWGDKSASAGGPPVVTNLWGEGESAGVKKPTVPQCPYHPQECRKGVCEWRAKQVREEERKKSAEKGGRGGAGKGRGPGSGTHARTSLGSVDGGSQDGFSTVTRGGRGRGRKGKDNRAGWDDGGASVKSGGSRAMTERGGWGNASQGPWA